MGQGLQLKKRSVKGKMSFGQHIKDGLQTSGVRLQRLGKSLMFPIAVLPIAALMNRIGSLMTDQTIGVVHGSAVWWIGQFVTAPGAAVFNNIAIIFAIGVAFGLAKDNRGEAALCGAVSYFILSLLTSENMIASLFYNHVMTYDGYLNKDMSSPHSFSSLLYIPVPFIPWTSHGDWQFNSGTYDLNTGVIGGIVCGAMVAGLYNKYKGIQLPEALAFFGGRRFIPMVTVVCSFLLAFVFAAVWPWIQLALIKIGTAISSGTTGAALGAGIYAFVNRLLQPFGAHHIINTFLWFQLPITGKLLPGVTASADWITTGNGTYIIFGDITAFNDGIVGSGIFQAGFFPVFFGGIPATGLAMIMTAEKGKRKEVATFIGGVALVAFLTGIDEPIVFIWIFLSPLLLFIHAVLTALFAAAVVGMGIRLGFGFSAGLIDYLISVPKSWSMSLQLDGKGAQIAANPLWVFPLAAVMGVIYYFVWVYVIRKMNLQTPGRENFGADGKLKVQAATATTGKASFQERAENAADAALIKEAGKKEKRKGNKKEELAEKYDHMAQVIVEAVGKDNFKVIENCATRLRLVVKNNKIDLDSTVKAAGVFQVIRIGTEGLQLVIGTDVEHVADRVKRLVGPIQN